jgi:ornithine cyclodeaminase/alanine dehydrogenase-like protein (mu-crystallin family)
VLALSNNDILALLDIPQVISAVEEAAVAIKDPQTLLPQRQHLDWDDNTLLVMPTLVKQAIGAKLVCVVPGNAHRGLAVTNGIMILSDRETGLPLCLMNAEQLTAVRTGAIGALSIRLMTPKTVTTLGVVGCGMQGAWQAIFACAVRPIQEIFYCARSPQRAQQFTDTVRRHVPGARLIACPDATAMLNRAALVIAATTSATPTLPSEPTLLRGKHFVSVGSFKPSMQELPTAVYSLARQLVVDSDAARQEVGDVINPLRDGALRSEDIFHLRDLISGTHSIDVEQTTAFKGVGLAIYDVFVARAVYEEALRRNVGQAIDL